MNLSALNQILSSTSTLKKLKKIETSLMHVIEDELRKHLSETDALSNSIAITALRETIMQMMWTRLLLVFENAFNHAQTDIENKPVAVSDGSKEPVDTQYSRNASMAGIASIDPVDSDTRNRNGDELHAMIRDLNAENSSLRDENQQLRKVLEKVKKDYDELRRGLDFMPEWNDAKRDGYLTFKMNKKLIKMVEAHAKSVNLSLDALGSQLFISIIPEGISCIGPHESFKEDDYLM